MGAGPFRPTAARRSRRRGTVALEFALIAPLLLIFIIGVYDTSKAMLLYQQVYNAAHTVTISASNVSEQSDGSTSLTVEQAQQVMSAIYAEMPLVAAGVEKGTRSVTLTSVTFVPTPSTCVPSGSTVCATVANTVWSVPYNDANAAGFSPTTRPCGTLTQASPTAIGQGALTSLPTMKVVNPGPILVADVHYQYTPVFFSFVTGPIDFWASSYWPVRSTSSTNLSAPAYTQYDLANEAAGAGKCAGF